MPKFVRFGDLRTEQGLPAGVKPVTTFYLNPYSRSRQNIKNELDAVRCLLGTLTGFNTVTEEMDFKFLPRKEKNKDGKAPYAYATNALFSFDYSIRGDVPLNKEKTQALYVVGDKGTVFTRAQLEQCEALLENSLTSLDEKVKKEAKYKVKEASTDQPYTAPSTPLPQQKKVEVPKPSVAGPSTSSSTSSVTPSLPAEPKWVTVGEKLPKKQEKPHFTSSTPAARAPTSLPKPTSALPKSSSVDPAKDPSDWPDLKGQTVEIHVYQEDQLDLFAKLVRDEGERARNNQARKKSSF